jgi:hypothetical protein
VPVHAKTALEVLCELAALILAVAGILALLYVDRGGGWLLAVGFWLVGAVLITLSRSLRQGPERE